MDIKNKLANQKAKIICAVLASGPAIAAAQSASTPEAAIGSAKDKIVELVGVAGAAMVAVALAAVGWSVGVKLVKRLKGAS